MIRPMLSFPALAAAIALGGCVNRAPDHARPALASEAAYDGNFRPDGSAIASELAWRDFFVDPRLKTLIGTALANNRDLVAATARIEQARAQYRIDDSRRRPEVVADASASRTRQPLNVGAFGGQGGGQGAGSITFNRFDIGVGITGFELDFWGRVRNLSEASRAQYLATIAAQRSFYLSLIGDVSTTYFEMVETQEQIELARATAESREEGLRIAGLRLDNGVTSALPYRQAETLLRQAQQELASQELDHARLRNQLAVLVGGTTPADLPPGLPLLAQENQIRLDAGLPSDLLLARPDIIAAEERLRAARANIGAARAAFFPNISLTGSAGYSSNALDNLFDGNSLSWSFGPSISLPIFDWGAREGQLDLAKAMEVEEVANYDLAVQTAFREVSDALAGRRWLIDQVETLTHAVTAQEEIARIARARYREGVADYLEVLDAERNLFSARQTLLATERAYRQNSVTLYIALGGGQLAETGGE
ncbi:multidrug efflux system outer membrane protein [Altererythrobacter atlanticus]|uniref:Outer membrane protein OprM n=1 Tax=Croceibacterium atlanticum TaxID=1267766 RepID=A0A0F7KQU7_9SPHN|nr:efflux transporter outer membrane subunit [Croceibacterium atlanticum]AKH42868.1 Outer membrane protein OprM precursor [Croceibacterium atlanticum]MBB5731648.1 multidrug efflux system outer membrane protein [Croceibacterium atlanticum]